MGRRHYNSKVGVVVDKNIEQNKNSKVDKIAKEGNSNKESESRTSDDNVFVETEDLKKFEVVAEKPKQKKQKHVQRKSKCKFLNFELLRNVPMFLIYVLFTDSICFATKT
jgi:hypothetical protein